MACLTCPDTAVIRTIPVSAGARAKTVLCARVVPPLPPRVPAHPLCVRPWIAVTHWRRRPRPPPSTRRRGELIVEVRTGDGPSEWAIIELQGTIEGRDKLPLNTVELGALDCVGKVGGKC